MSKWIGYAVSVNCGEPLGCYQGTILEADGTTITLTKAFRNGFPYPKSQVTLNAADIKELKIIESAAEPAEQPHSTVAVAKSKKGHRATVCETLQASHNTGGLVSSGSGTSSNTKQAAGGVGGRSGPGAGVARTKPIDIQPRPNKNNNQSGSFGNGSTPKSREGKSGGGGGGGGAARRRNEMCFGSAAAGALDDEFDFEGNLALFDKRAIWEQMRAARPDLLRAQPDDKFRHDENVLGGGGHAGPGAPPLILPPDELRAPLDYVTDGGALVGGAAPRLRRDLWDGLQRLGLLDFSQAMLARAAADVALRLVGGGRRLEARNAHQAPRVVALSGAHRAGAQGLAAARLLASHGARAAALVAPGPPPPALARELAAAALGEVTLVSHPRDLPSPDLVLLALYDPQLDDPQEPHASVLSWAMESRAALVALEPPARGWPGVCVRASVVGLVPPALPADLGRVYLADVAPPARLFSERRVSYRPPFGASSLLALHPADE